MDQDPEESAIAAAMGFASFGTQKVKDKRGQNVQKGSSSFSFSFSSFSSLLQRKESILLNNNTLLSSNPQRSTDHHYHQHGGPSFHR